MFKSKYGYHVFENVHENLNIIASKNTNEIFMFQFLRSDSCLSNKIVVYVVLCFRNDYNRIEILI